MIQSFKSRSLEFSKPVQVYRCLNRKGKIFSVKQNGLVVAHGNNFTLKNVDFVVNESGKRRAIETHTRNVHAVVKGILQDQVLFSGGKSINYNPYNKQNFTCEGKEINKANYVCFTDGNVFKVD